jgi:hypothetical protein
VVRKVVGITIILSFVVDRCDDRRFNDDEVGQGVDEFDTGDEVIDRRGCLRENRPRLQ